MLQKNNRFKIMKIFLDNPSSEYHLRELSRISKLSTTTVKTVTSELVKKEIITKKNERNYVLFKSNKDSQAYKNRKKNYTQNKLSESGLLDFLEKELNYPDTIVLFGSASRGEDTERSDIDLFILSTIKKDLDLKKFEKKIGRPIKLLSMNRKELENLKKKNPELLNNIINGIVIYGYLEVM